MFTTPNVGNAGDVTKTNAVLTMLQGQYQVELIALLDTNMTIIAQSTNNKNHIGRVMDPEGLVTRAKQQPGEPLWTYGTLAYDDLYAEHPPLYRDRTSSLDMAAPMFHPYEVTSTDTCQYTSVLLHYLHVVLLVNVYTHISQSHISTG